MLRPMTVKKDLVFSHPLRFTRRGGGLERKILALDPVVWLDAQREANNISQGALTFLASDNQYNQADTAAETAYPVSFAVWFKCSANGTLIWLGDKDADDIYLTMALVAGALTATAESAADGADTATTAATTYADDAWHLGVTVFDGISQSIYVDDVAVVTNTATNTIAGTFDRTAIGHFGGTTAATPAEGEISQSAVFNVALTSAQRSSMYNSGTMIDFADIVTPTAQWFNDGPSRVKWEDRVGGLNLTAAGGTGQPELVTGLRNDAATFVAANTQRLEVDTAAFTDYPYTMACWFKTGTTGALQVLMFSGDKDSNNEYTFLRLNASEDLQAGVVSLADGPGIATKAGTFTDDAWHLVIGVYTSATDRDVSVDGGTFVNNTTSVTIGSTYDRVTLGREGIVASGRYHDGEIDEPMVWTSALSQADATALYNGGTPLSLQQVQSLIAPPQHHWSLDTHAPYLDAQGTLDLTPFGDKLLPVSVAGPDEIVAVEGSALEQWVDRGANGNTPLQATVLRRPQLVRVPWVNDQGYMLAVRFDGVDDHVLGAYGSAITQPFTITCVFRHSSPQDGVTGYMLVDDDSTDVILFKRNADTIRGSAGSNLTSDAATANYEILTWIVDGANSSIRRNRVEVVTGDSGSNGMSGISVGAQSTAGNALTGEMLEVLVIDEALSGGNLVLVEDYLANKYNLNWGDAVATGPAAWFSASSNGIKTNNDGNGNDVADTEAVGFWNDVSGNIHDASESTGSQRPTFDAINSSFNNRPVISFDGGDNVSILDPVDLDNGVGLTIGFVANLTAATANHYLIEKASTYSLWIDSDGEVHFALGTDGDAYATVIANLDAGITAGTPFIIVIQYVTTAIKLYINGVQKGSSVTSVNGDILDTTADVIIGASDNAGTDGWVGEIADGIIFNRGLSNAELNAHFNQIAAFYGIGWTDI